ncbi:glycosyltransferase, partial [Shewanella sp. SG44-6]|uniref:glycosyltransferase n=1 Tax=Shewanella sp. SG44-6 TaxID=2760959 RepID=UPI001600BB70
IRSIYEQVDYVIIVNNGLQISISNLDIECKNLKIIDMEGNKGIGYAQNCGVIESSRLGCKYSILFDQDSSVNDGFVSKILDGFVASDVVAVGPSIIDSRSKKVFSYYTYSGLKRKKSILNPVVNDHFHETDVLISSGSIVCNSIFIENLNNSNLFIEYVDVEWCLRMRQKNYRILFSDSVNMQHELGDSRERLFGIEFPIHKPERYFFVVRNGIYCCFNSNFPFSFRYYNFIRILILSFLVLIKTDKKLTTMISMIKGLLGKVNV